MKRLFTLVAFVLAMVVSSCSYDDTQVWDKLNNHENRISQLEELCREMNTNISALQSLVEASQNGDYITSVTPIVKDGETVGYTITFAKSEAITIYNGKDGEDGADGTTGNGGAAPVIGVKKHTDGVYYWTIDGEWLTDANGNKVKAEGTDGEDGVDGKDGINGEDGKDGADGEDGKDGADGVTPRLKIENNYWYVSYDEGKTWDIVGAASTSGGGDSIFSEVKVNSDSVTFVLSDGSSFTLPTSAQTDGDIIRFLDNGVKVRCVTKWDVDGDNELSKTEAAAVKSLEGIFIEATDIIAFDELKYFTGITELQDDEFSYCLSLMTITLPENLVKIGNWAFCDCMRLESLVMPNSVTTIGDYAFADCSRLKTIDLSDNLKTIGYSTFDDCRALTSITLPESLEEIRYIARDNEDYDYYYNNPFRGCYSLEAFYGKGASADNRSLVLDGRLFSIAPAGLTEYTIPEGVTTIGSYAAYCYTYREEDDSRVINLRSITIPESVTHIEYHGILAQEYHFLSKTPPTMEDNGRWLAPYYEGEYKPVIYIPDGAEEEYVNGDWDISVKALIDGVSIPLDSPDLYLRSYSENEYIVSWDSVDYAEYYIVEFGDETYYCERYDRDFYMEGLFPGTYTVTVTAVPYEDSIYSNSLPSSVTFTIDYLTPEECDWATVNVWLPTEEDESNGYYPWERILASISGSYIEEIRLGVVEADIYNEYSTEELAKLCTIISDEFVYSANNEGLSWYFIVQPEKEYRTIIALTNSYGQTVIYDNYITTSPVRELPNIDNWIGSWNLTANQGLTFSMVNGYVDFYLTDQTVNLEIEISPAPEVAPNAVYIEGLSNITWEDGSSIIAMGYVNGNGILEVVSATHLAYMDDGKVALWLGWSYIDGEITPVMSERAWYLEISDDGQHISTAGLYNGIYDGGTFEFLAMDVFAKDVDTGQIYLLYDFDSSSEHTIPAGEISLTRAETATQLRKTSVGQPITKSLTPSSIVVKVL